MLIDARMRARHHLLTLGLVFAAAIGPRPAHAIVVERIVAVVGDDPILMSELRARAKPFLLQIQQRVRPGAEQAAAESEVFKDLLVKMIDERLESQAAMRAGVQVTKEEIDNALRNIAAAQGMSVADLLKEARARSGMVEQDYRDEIRRQILEGKIAPPACPLFGKRCTPASPVGPCMVSSEGTCSAWFTYGN